jgi:hypothetical protein
LRPLLGGGKDLLLVGRPVVARQEGAHQLR